MRIATLKILLMCAAIYGIGVALLLQHPVAGVLSGLGIILCGVLDRIELTE
jgi:hypothetical protein